MATEKDFRVKSSLQAPTSVKVGSAEITSSGTDIIFPAGIQTSGVGVPQITSASSVTITAPDGINLNGSALATESYVNTQVSNVSVDLTGYATETYVNNTVANYLTISSFNTQISSYALTTDVNNALALKANTSSLAAVATSGNYNDLSNTPTIPSLSGYATETYVNTQISNIDYSSYATQTDLTNGLATKVNTSSLATVATSGNYNDLSNTPTIPSLSGYATENALGVRNLIINGDMRIAQRGTSVSGISN